MTFDKLDGIKEERMEVRGKSTAEEISEMVNNISEKYEGKLETFEKRIIEQQILEKIPSYTMNDLQTALIILANINRKTTESYLKCRGLISGILLTELARKLNKKGERADLKFYGAGTKFDLLFRRATDFDSLTIDGFEGDHIGEGIATKTKPANILVRNIRGKLLLAFAQGLETIVAENLAGENLLEAAAPKILIIRNSKDCSYLAERLGHGARKVELVVLDNVETTNKSGILYDCASYAGEVNTIIASRTKGITMHNWARNEGTIKKIWCTNKTRIKYELEKRFDQTENIHYLLTEDSRENRAIKEKNIQKVISKKTSPRRYQKLVETFYLQQILDKSREIDFDKEDAFQKIDELKKIYEKSRQVQ